jgi:hypothetical protein
MNMPPVTRRSFPHAQRGAASVAIAILILFILAAALATVLSMSGSVVRDAAMSEEQVEALFLAESGIERAAYNYGLSGGICTSAAVSPGATTYTLGNGSFTLVSVVTSGSYCQIRVQGTVRGTTRTLDAGLAGGGTGIAFGAPSGPFTANSSSLTWSHTVAGTNRILVVGVSIRNNAGQFVNANGVTYAGTPLTLVGSQNNGTSVRVELWQGVAPAVGTANIVVTLSASARFVGGAVSLTGVDQTSPVDGSGSSFASGSSATPSVSVTTTTNNAWVVDVLATRLNATATVGPGQTSRWNTDTGAGPNGVLGAGSTEGPKTPAGGVTMSWSLGATSQEWAIGAVALKPVGATPKTWSEVVN